MGVTGRGTSGREADGSADMAGRDAARCGRTVAIVLIVTMALWLGLQALGAAMSWPAALAFAFDIVALAAFGWALVTTYGIWRRRNTGS